MSDGKKSIIASLADVSFSSFITTRVISIVYILGLIGSAITALFMLATGLGMMRYGAGLLGLGYILLSIGAFCLMVLSFRMILEFIVVVFKIAENIEKTARK